MTYGITRRSAAALLLGAMLPLRTATADEITVVRMSYDIPLFICRPGWTGMWPNAACSGFGRERKSKVTIVTVHHLKVTPDTTRFGILDAAFPAVIEINSGDTVEIECVLGGPDIMPGPESGLVVPKALSAIHDAKPQRLEPHIITGSVATVGAPGSLPKGDAFYRKADITDVLALRSIYEYYLGQVWGSSPRCPAVKIVYVFDQFIGVDCYGAIFLSGSLPPSCRMPNMFFHAASVSEPHRRFSD